MIVKQLSEALDLKVVAGEGGLTKEIKGAFVGDLLSIVMAHAKEADVWITVQGHINSVAVAVLVSIPVIILTQDIMPNEEMIQKANEEAVTILTTPKNSFEIAKALAHMLEELEG